MIILLWKTHLGNPPLPRTITTLSNDAQIDTVGPPPFLLSTHLCERSLHTILLLHVPLDMPPSLGELGINEIDLSFPLMHPPLFFSVHVLNASQSALGEGCITESNRSVAEHSILHFHFLLEEKTVTHVYIRTIFSQNLTLLKYVILLRDRKKRNNWNKEIRKNKNCRFSLSWNT